MMTTIIYKFRILPAMLLMLVAVSCEKYLDEKPDKTLAVPGTTEDLQLLLNNYRTMNQRLPNSPILLADNIYLDLAGWQSIPLEVDRNFYLWEKDDNTTGQWSDPYTAIYTANVVLDALGKIDRDPVGDQEWNQVKGSALFFRGVYLFAVSQLFAPPYRETTADHDLGIPLRLSPDIDERSERSTVKETYEQIVRDLESAASLLPVTPLVKTRPGKPAAYGALARTYLAMQDYERAGLYADSCLRLYNRLIDYNELDTAAGAPVERFNDEVIFHIMSPSGPASPSRARIDSVLYRSYHENDLRKGAFFRDNGDGSYAFKGDYDGNGNGGYVFGGIVTDEMYLIRAECLARKGSAAEAMRDLNTLLEKRWVAGTFAAYTASGPDEALEKILEERRKELLFRGTRWTDLRRFRDDPEFAVTPVRVMNGRTYQLPPGSPRYVLQIPEPVIELSGMPQNP